MNERQTYLLVDGTDVPSEANIYYWSANSYNEKSQSIPVYLEANAEKIRDKYLTFVYNLRHTQIDGKPLYTWFTDRNGYNSWWMGLIEEKNLVKSPAISDCLKLLALEEIIAKDQPEMLYATVSDEELLLSLERLCQQLDIPFKGTLKSEAKKSTGNVYDRLPRFLQPIALLANMTIKAWKLRTTVGPEIFNGGRSVLFISHFLNFDTSTINTERIYTKYWETLPALIQQKDIAANWLYFFDFSSSVPNANIAVSWLEKLNKSIDRHRLLIAGMDSGIVYRSLKKFYFFYTRGKKLKKIFTHFNSNDRGFFLWPLLHKDWLLSIQGRVLMENLILIELFDKAMRLMPYQQMGLYLQENSGWERAFVHGWKKHKHGKLVGVTHTTIRFWDLRFFDYNRTYEDKNAPPQPDYISVNGPVPAKMLITSGVPSHKIINLEALRYLSSDKFSPVMPKSIEKSSRVLLCGDIDFKSTHEMLRCVEASVAEERRKKYSFLFKAHPVCPVTLQPYDIPEITLVDETVNELLSQVDTVVSTDSTTAGVEAYLRGLKVIVYCFSKRANFSPLKGVKKVIFVNTPQQMVEGLEANYGWSDKEQPEQFFWDDASLPRWKKLLEEIK